MFSKRALFATSAIAVLAGAGQAQAGDFYFSVLGGANWMPEKGGFQATPLSTTYAGYHADPETGFVVAGAVGMHLDHWLPGLRAELEASYRRNNVHGNWSSATFSSGPTGGKIDAKLSNFAVMANVWYDIDFGSKLVPYFGGGAGWDRAKFDGVFVETFTNGGSNTANHGHFSRSENGFAYQVGAGVNYQIQSGVNLGVGYRFFRGPSVSNDVFFGKNQLTPLNVDNENHAVMVNLTIDAN